MHLETPTPRTTRALGALCAAVRPFRDRTAAGAPARRGLAVFRAE